MPIARVARFGMLIILMAGFDLKGQMQTSKYQVSEQKLPDGRRQEVLTNTYTSPIVAFHASTQCPPTDSQLDVDNLLYNQPAWQVSPGRSYKFRAPGIPDICPFKVDAVLFGDGSTEGSAEAVAGIFDHRKGLQEELSMLRPVVSQVLSGNSGDQMLRDYLAERQAVLAKQPHANLSEDHGRRAVLSTFRRQMKYESEPGASSNSETSSVETRLQDGLAFLDKWISQVESTATAGGPGH